ncbi:WD40-like Beta Propeller Repeat [Arenibacter nanhaiticus]|uniref:WD40-like Beta Propeller Repeat n=1 Tax=Arenibacter nanhaiticus TaxID=558155 RepID=A0A1M6A192_9FLAO|nr:OmpA family protein [Arenibacter nanhaiticus]SHI30264.1 WD40-like Beta Propeller Repeat [Arenibacter nanhaiticus]
MKKSLTACFLLLCFYGMAQEASMELASTQTKDLLDLQLPIEQPLHKEEPSNSPMDEKTFAKITSEKNITSRTFYLPKSVAEGFYLISKVYESDEKAQELHQEQLKKGFLSGIVNAFDTQYNYVYLNHYTVLEEAMADYNSKFNGRYKGYLWLLQVINDESVETARPTTALLSSPAIAATRLPKPMPSMPLFDEALAAEKATITTAETTAIGDSGSIPAPTVATTALPTAIQAITLFDDEIAADKTRLFSAENTDMASDANLAPALTAKDFSTLRTTIAPITEINRPEPVPLTMAATFLEELEEDNTPPLADNSAENIQATSKSTTSKLVKRANLYFDKLWYAEAAEIYEKELKKGKKYYQAAILRKAADAHYFNTNMERAYHWYHELYLHYKDSLAPEELFKYAHTLKGVGKYGRAKRMMRQYNRQLEENNSQLANTEAELLAEENEMDIILNNENNVRINNLSINTEYSDFSPMFYQDKEVVFASAKDSSFFSTRTYKWNNQPYLDLYVSRVNEDTEDLINGHKFSNKINTKYHEAAVSFSPDYKTMYFTRNNYGKKLGRDKNGVNHLKIYTSKKIGGEWTEANEMPFNSDDYSTGHPAVSPDGKKLYFVSDMPGTLGDTDIFVVDVLENDTYSSPKNLGPGINTPKKEMFPFVTQNKLYFSSNGHMGLGGLDVFETDLTDGDGFGPVKNVGRPINSNKDDFSYIIDEADQKGYFASNRAGGKGDDDIYSFNNFAVEEVFENAIAGHVTEFITGEALPNARVELYDENSDKITETMTDTDGYFIFEALDSQTKYAIKTSKTEFFDQTIDTQTLKNDVVNVNLTMKKLKEMIVMEGGEKKLKTDIIYFDFDKSYIRQDAAKELDKLVEVMTEYEEMVIKIASHTDSRGSDVYNKYLSDQRAKATRDYLISQGIAKNRIASAKGYGEEQPINECSDSVPCSRAKHELNRRSEFIIVKM